MGVEDAQKLTKLIRTEFCGQSSQNTTFLGGLQAGRRV